MSYRLILACVVAALTVRVGAAQGASDTGHVKPGPKAAQTTDPGSKDPFDKFKNIRLTDELTLSFGGSMRARYEVQDNFDFDDSSAGQGTFGLLRTRLSMDINYAKAVRLFAEGQDSRIHGFDSHVRPQAVTFFEDQFDIHQLFVDAKLLGAEGPLTLRVGRQELLYGAQRLIGPFGWNNVSRTYDGAKLIFKKDKVQIDAFYVRPISPPKGIHRKRLNEPDWSNRLYGVYSAIAVMPKHTLEPYFIVHDERDRVIVDSTGSRENFRTYTAGARFVGEWGGFDYGVEGAGQWGSWGHDSHRAWAAHGRAGYTFARVPWSPRLGAEYNFATGDSSPTDGRHGTFYNLFPTNHLHYGYMDFMNWSNMRNLRFNLKIKPLKRLTMVIDQHFFWLDQAEDAWRNAGGVPIRRDPTGNSGNYIGREIDVTVKYVVNKHLKLMVGAAKFFTSTFVSRTGPGDNAEWAFTQAVFTF